MMGENVYSPLSPGQYYVDEIVLDDGDPFTADPLRTGWYFSEPFFSTSKYYVDEREMSGFNLLFYNFGLSGISITRFTLP
jgi:hypothetical protein